MRYYTWRVHLTAKPPVIALAALLLLAVLGFAVYGVIEVIV